MGLNSALHDNAQRCILLAPTTITTAVGATASTPITDLSGMKYVAATCKFTVASSGTSAKVYVQTSLDGGISWIDIMSFAFATTALVKVSAVNAVIAPAAQGFTATDGTLADNTIQQGVLGDRLRIKYVTTGTYDASLLSCYAVVKG